MLTTLNDTYTFNFSFTNIPFPYHPFFILGKELAKYHMGSLSKSILQIKSSIHTCFLRANSAQQM